MLEKRIIGTEKGIIETEKKANRRQFLLSL